MIIMLMETIKRKTNFHLENLPPRLQSMLRPQNMYIFTHLHFLLIETIFSQKTKYRYIRSLYILTYRVCIRNILSNWENDLINLHKMKSNQSLFEIYVILGMVMLSSAHNYQININAYHSQISKRNRFELCSI